MSHAARAALVAAAVLAFVVAASGVVVSYNPYSLWVRGVFAHGGARWAAAGYTNYYELLRFSWEFALVWSYFSFPVRRMVALFVPRFKLCLLIG